MKIIHICWEYIDNFGYQEELLPKAHARLGHEVVVIAPIKIFAPFYKMAKTDWEKTKEYFLDGVKIIRLKQISDKKNRFTFLCGLYKRLEFEKPDIIFVHMIQSISMFSAKRYKKIHPECKFFVDSHADSYNSGRNLVSKLILHKIIWRFVAQRTLFYVDKIFYIAPMSKTFLEQMYFIPEAKLAPLYLGADMSKISQIDKNDVRMQIRRKLAIPDNALVVITGGKISPEKKTHNLLKAINEINYHNVFTIVFGNIESEYLKDMEILINQNNKTKYLKWIDSKEIYQYFLASDIAVFPGTQSVLWQEAICMGLPTVFKKWPGGEYLDVGGNTMFIFSDDYLELKQLLLFIFENPKKLETMKRVATQNGEKKFSYDNIAKQIFQY